MNRGIMTRAGVLNTIDSLLGSVSNPTFTAVLRGEPLLVPSTPIVSFWLAQHEEDFTTLGDASTIAEFTIRCYWRVPNAQDVRESLELEVWDAIASIKSALRGDSNLSDNCTDSRPGFASTGYIDLSGITFKVMSMPFFVDIYGSETITP
jgi:hypothetical protein|tara:strand:+ start:145 stop:594 length:450 start_codon:yes stop_codon:yes gene_type:complete